MPISLPRHPDTLALPGPLRGLAALQGRLAGLLWPGLLALGAGGALLHYGGLMDRFEQGILLAAAGALAWSGQHWPAVVRLSLAAGLVAAAGCLAHEAAPAGQSFLLHYFLSSQSLIMWMSTLFALSGAAYVLHLWRGSDFVGQLGAALCWGAVCAGLSGLLVRWRESYLLGADIGHIPISNLYEVLVLFCLITALIYLYHEWQGKTRALGAFVLPLIAAAVAFLLWYAFARAGHSIQPLVPALRSYWMKLHVPANFIGYGCFAVAAMLGCAWLTRDTLGRRRPEARLLRRLPDTALLDQLLYRTVTLGFSSFTLATVLGSLWAAEAWGAYWSWDPKESWALIVWLNYAAWLHARMGHAGRGRLLAWWAIAGLLITLFAFLGVNLFLSGLHSYGQL